MIKRREFLRAALGLATGAPVSASTDWPKRPVRVVVPFSAGGVTDLVTREVVQAIGPTLGTTFVVENRAGAGGNLGATAVARAEPDGYTLLAGTLSTYALNAALYKNLGHDPRTDLMPVALTALVPIVLVVTPSLGVKDLQGFIARLQANPGRYNYASAGNGTSSHIALHMLLTRTGTRAEHIAYRGTANALTEMLADAVQIAVASPAVVQTYINGGRLVPLAVISPNRLPSLPEVPTIAEAGLPNFDVYSWNGLFAPARTPDAVLDRLYDAVEQALSQPALRRKLEDQGTLPMTGRSRAEVGRYVQAEYQRWVPYVRELNLKLD